MPDRSVLTLGNFDGPHVGHLAILDRAKSLARQHDARVTAITFDPPPIKVLRPGQEPPTITPLDQRIARLKAGGADEVIVLNPTPELLGQPAEEFIARLVEQHQPVAIVEGPDFRFGKGRGGDMDTLAELGQRHGFEAVTVPRVEAPLSDQQLAPVSSSLVRWLVGRGRVADAAVCLGQPFSLTAKVVRGEQRGRQLDIPTANLDAETIAPFIVPADGVYAGLAEISDSVEGTANQKSSIKNPKSIFPAAISVGVKPTFGRTALTVEAHLLDYRPDAADDLYGQTLTLHFARWVRDQYPFPGVGPLREQLFRDIEQTRQWHASGVLEPDLSADHVQPSPVPRKAPA
ncbi:MAG: bifunctional riboflavin kinase/FMN adenylyltransferase [Planctomycetota bacterium]